MFFRKKCDECAGHKAEVEHLCKELDAARREIAMLKSTIEVATDLSTQVVFSSDFEKVPTQNPPSSKNYYDKNIAWENASLEDIEREIKRIYEIYGRHHASIAAVNELQAIQHRIIEQGKVTLSEDRVKHSSKPSRKPYNKQVAHSAVGAICERYAKQFKSIVLRAPTDWTAASISDVDRKALLAFIEQYAHKVAKLSGFRGNPENFGALLSKDERVWDRLVNSQIPKLLKVVDRVDQERQQKSLHWTMLQPILDEALSSHKTQLIRNLRMSYIVDEYGAVKKDLRNTEIRRFLVSVNLYLKADRAGLPKVSSYIKSWASKEINRTSMSTPLPENGLDFEHWVKDRLSEHQWDARVTQGSGDQGVDVVAIANNVRVAIQCKLYTGSVGNKAVQEVLAGMTFFDLDRGVIISTGNYTKSAHALASKNQILLLTPNDIPYLSDLLQT